MPATAVLTPTTSPLPVTSAPPELPGFSAASVWMTLSMMRPVRRVRAGSERPSADTTPAVTEPAKPCGLPIATTSWPTRRRSASPSGAGSEVARLGAQRRRGRRAGRRRRPRSETRGRRRTSRGRARRRPATTCAEVSRKPSGVSTTALPAPDGHLPAARAPRDAQVRDGRARAPRRRRDGCASRRRAPRPRSGASVDGASCGTSVALDASASRRLAAAHDRRARAPRGRPRRARRRGRRRPSTGCAAAATIRSPRCDAGPVGGRCRPRRRARAGRRPLGQADRAAQPARHVGRGARATPRRRGAAASPAARRVDARRAPSRRRPARGSGRRRRRRLLTPSRRPSPSTSGPPDEPRGSGAVCSMAPGMRRPRGPRNARPGRGDEAEGRRAGRDRRGWRARPPASPMPAAVRVAQPRAGASPVSTSITARSRSASAPGDAAALAAAVGEGDGDLVAAQVVGVGEDPAVGDDDAGAAAPAASEADDRRADPVGDAADGRGKLFKNCRHVYRLPSDLQIASNPTIRGQVLLCKIRDPVRQRKT